MWLFWANELEDDCLGLDGCEGQNDKEKNCQLVVYLTDLASRPHSSLNSVRARWRAKEELKFPHVIKQIPFVQTWHIWEHETRFQSGLPFSCNQSHTAIIFSLKEPSGTNFFSKNAVPIVKPYAPLSLTSMIRS